MDDSCKADQAKEQAKPRKLMPAENQPYDQLITAGMDEVKDVDFQPAETGSAAKNGGFWFTEQP